MKIRQFFHKFKMVFVRAAEQSIPNIDEAKRFGNDGEDKFEEMLKHELSSCKMKRNVVITTQEGNAEIDCIILHNNKLFAIEIKRWKGHLTEQNDGFLQEKTDKWTEETHTKLLKSPFKQLGRSIHLLRKQIPIKVWVNSIVFFEDCKFKPITTSSDNVWFDQYQDLVNYIKNDGKASCNKNANDFFDKCIPADYLSNDKWEKSLYCVIDRNSLQFKTPQGIISADNMSSIQILHHLSYDELHITMLDSSVKTITLENAKIQVSENGITNTYALCKLDYIKLGKTLCL